MTPAGSHPDGPDAPPPRHRDIVHATCVAFGARGVLILGPSGAGKSALGLQLIALGACLVADDRTALEAAPGAVFATAPPGLPPLIEARGLGLLRARTCPRAQVVLAVDLGRRETDRLPPARHTTLAGVTVGLVFGVDGSHFPAAIRQIVLLGREE